MVERSGRGKRKRKLLANHQRCWIWGRNLVRETLLAGRWPILELHLADDLPAGQLAEAQHAADQRAVPMRISPRARLEQLGHSTEHQGYLAKMGPFPLAGAEELLAGASARPLYLLLDAIQDPYNFGAMLRSAGAFSVDGVFVGNRNQATVNSLVARSSAGVVNRVPIAEVEDLAGLARELQQRGIRVVGASEKATRPIATDNFRAGTAIVVGNEGAGISADLLACCDAVVRIPLAGEVDSLNAAAATAVLLYEIRRQREEATGERPHEPHEHAPHEADQGRTPG
jgi:23S rRNA (guanosine2251-2'-O)-methyltransferase